MATTKRETLVDLREVEPQARTAVALYTSQLLRPGQTMQVIDDHDPVDLQSEFQSEPARFGWQWMERGPEVWRVGITRRALPASVTSTSADASTRDASDSEPATSVG